MMICEILLLCCACVLCGLSVWTDLRHGQIKNKHLVVGFTIGLALNIVYYAVYCRDCLGITALNLFISALLSIGFYFVHIWSAGDSKLLIVLISLLSENNMLNQILKTTVMLLLRNGKVKAKYKDDLKKKMLYFSNVDSIEPTEIKWSSIRFQRNNQTYRMLVSICQLMIEGMLITTDAGNYRLASFVDEQRMCRLYEKFILEYYSRHYPELSVSASQIPWALDDGVGTMLPVMQTDIHLQRGNTVLIIDAKYYSHTTQVHFDKHKLHSNNLYQIFTYVKNRSYQFGEEDNTVSGMLLYAKTEEEIQPDNVYQMHGSQISVKTLDLNLPFVEIAAQMDRIVESHFTGVIKAD